MSRRDVVVQRMDEIKLPECMIRTIGLGSSHAKNQVEADHERELRLRRQRRILTKKMAVAIDGFVLLDACGVEFPDEGLSADVSGYGAHTVAQADLQYFPRLAAIDASDNHYLEPTAFSSLPKLKELKLAANGLDDISLDASLCRLLVLDLSYNHLSAAAVPKLASLAPTLRELDLTANHLHTLPSMCDFLCLEKLSLEANALTDKCLQHLAPAPKLRDLRLAYNDITLADDAARLDRLGDEPLLVFRELDSLGLGFNKITLLEHILPLAQLPKLEFLAVYGNPLVHDERRAVENAEAFVAVALKSRQGWTDRKMQLAIHVPTSRPARRRAAIKRGTLFPPSASTTARVAERPMPTHKHFKQKGRALLDIDHKPPKPVAPTADQNTKRNPHTELPHAEPPASMLLPGQDYLEPFSLHTAPIDSVPDTNHAKMRAAIKALKFALDHPITTHGLEKLPCKRGGPVPFAVRPTRASLARTLPRRACPSVNDGNQNILTNRVAARQLQRNAMRQIEEALNDIDTACQQPSSAGDDQRQPVDVTEVPT